MNSEAKLIAVIGYVCLFDIGNFVSNTDLCYRAGVVGLQSSISLRRAGYRVILLAKHLPGDRAIEYTSPWYVLITLSGATSSRIARCLSSVLSSY